MHWELRFSVSRSAVSFRLSSRIPGARTYWSRKVAKLIGQPLASGPHRGSLLNYRMLGDLASQARLEALPT